MALLGWLLFVVLLPRINGEYPDTSDESDEPTPSDSVGRIPTSSDPVVPTGPTAESEGLTNEPDGPTSESSSLTGEEIAGIVIAVVVVIILIVLWVVVCLRKKGGTGSSSSSSSASNSGDGIAPREET
jgi:hypothetical protein